MNIFPCSWNLPSPLNSPTSNFNFLTEARALIPKMVKASIPTLTEVSKQYGIPLEEMCVGENNDFSEIDKMLEELNDDSSDAKINRTIHAIENIKNKLEENIQVIQDPFSTSDSMSREDVLRLLKSFSDYLCTIENYLKELKTCPK